MNPFCTFVASTAGRIIRIVVGVAPIAWGPLLQGEGTAGIIVVVVGAVPLLAGTLDFYFS